ncbi:MAG: hypothetical protein PHU46_14655 [Rhodocyclaceae bacterium]|nr:hypothetical protein [Rhodocyclaceae bacterium]
METDVLCPVESSKTAPPSPPLIAIVFLSPFERREQNLRRLTCLLAALSCPAGYAMRSSFAEK